MSAKFFNTPNVTSEEYVAFWDEFHHIVDQAGQSITDEKTVLARFGLYDLVKKYGQQFRNKDVAGRDKALNMSMDCLLSLVHPGNTGWTDSLKMVREILNDTSQPVERRLKIVASLHEKMLAKGALRDSALPSFQSAISTVLAGALEAECRAPDIPKEQTQKFQYDRREEFRLKLLASLKDAQSLQMLPRAAGFHIVEAMSGLADDPRSTLPFPRFRKECRDFVTDLRYSVLTLSAVADGRADDSSLNKRAQSIKDALAQNTGGNPLYSGADASLMLFRACCGAGLTNPSDPRKTPLYQALLSTPLDEKTLDPAKSLDEASIVRQDHAQMVSLSAAILILDRRNHAFSDEDKRRASETIAYLAAHGARFGIRRDAKRVIDEGLASQPQNATPAGGLRPGATADPRLGK